MSLAQVADDANHNAHDARIIYVDRVHGTVRRLQANSVLFGKPVLESRLAIVGSSNHHLTGSSLFLLLHNDVVATGDLSVDHGIAVDLEDEQVSPPKEIGKIDSLLLLEGQGR